MSAISSPALALARAFDSVQQSSVRAVSAAQNGDDSGLADALTDQLAAKIDVKAALATVRFADEMYKALLDIKRAR